ncbi:SDR family NAD(P)-dependent oxidoreductase [Thermodesulfobacteriota bacterium]
MKLTDKIALVTGAGSGIGKATARILAENGADIAVNDIDLASAEATADEIRQLGRKVISVQADVADAEAVDSMVDEILNEMGGIHILVNNAGIPVHGGFVENQTAENWDRVIGIILRGTYLCSRRAGKWMIDNQYGRIVNIASIAGIRCAPDSAGYGAGKAGVINLTKTLAVEWGRYNINVNCIAPGLIDTPLTQRTFARSPAINSIIERIPKGRMGTAEEIARAVLFLVSEDAEYITGVTLRVDGGQLARI